MSAAQLPRLCDPMIKAVQAERKATRKAVQEATWVPHALASAKVMATPLPGVAPVGAQRGGCDETIIFQSSERLTAPCGLQLPSKKS